MRGTRIAVQTVLEFLAAGDSVEDVLEEYPNLTRADVQACLDYASRVMGNHFSVVHDGMKGFLFDENLPARVTFHAEAANHFRRQGRQNSQRHANLGICPPA